MATTDPFTLLLKATGDAIADVLDSYKPYYSNTTSVNYRQTITDVKALLEVVQDLESESAAGALLATSRRVKDNIVQVLNECGHLAKLLQTRIRDRTLRDDAKTSRDIQAYSAEIECFLRTYGRGERRVTDLSRTERYELDTLRHRYDEAQLEIAKLNSIIDGQAYRARGGFSGDSPTQCYCEARLIHIKRLHQAIACLGLRRPRDHGLDSWEELKGELPHMLDHIKGINEQLKDTEVLEMPASPTFSRSRTVHRRNPSEPQNVGETSFSSLRQRPPSPTGSNFSSRDSGSNFSASSMSRKRGSRGVSFSSNPGEWD